MCSLWGTTCKVLPCRLPASLWLENTRSASRPIPSPTNPSLREILFPSHLLTTALCADHALLAFNPSLFHSPFLLGSKTLDPTHAMMALKALTLSWLMKNLALPSALQPNAQSVHDS